MHLISQKLLLAGGLCALRCGHGQRPKIIRPTSCQVSLVRNNPRARELQGSVTASAAGGSSPALQVHVCKPHPGLESCGTLRVPPAPTGLPPRLCSRLRSAADLPPPAPRATPPHPSRAPLGPLLPRPAARAPLPLRRVSPDTLAPGIFL
ncbi:hypothetical protein HJG60_008651 [Phyllostomus discolor]|uniref:Uncharacterized protein n=1 Tax=Phyllostomus discolor TaxID=89673 RepID=A0A833Z170_9CHIR|nr:hypothetical protein HJG60_008651 [Phyllostomus discolor]